MNPVLALGLVAAAGIAVTRLPRLSVRHLPHAQPLFATGTPLLLLGLVLGPGIGVLEGPALRALAPVTALAIGWIGAAFGSRFEWRVVRRIPRARWALGLLQSAVVLILAAGAAWLLMRARPELGAAWVPAVPAILTIAAAAATSLAAGLDTTLGALVFTVALAVYHPTQPVPDASLAWYEWLVLAVGGGLLVGIVFLWLMRLDPKGHPALPLLGTVLFGSGVGYAADLSPFVVSAIAAALIVNASPARRRVRAVLGTWEQPIYAVFLIIAGAVLRLPTFWILAAVPVFVVLRVAATWVAVRLGRSREARLATVAQGSVALALAVNFYIAFAGFGTGAVVTTIVLGVVATQLVASALVARAPRPAPA